MQFFSAGNLTLSLDLPSPFQERINILLTSFLSPETQPVTATFTVKPAYGSFTVDDATKRGTFYYREYSPYVFDILERHFNLHIDLCNRSGSLQIDPSAIDQPSIIYNSIKWFMTFIVIYEGGVPFHSSLIADSNDGILFSGASGSGKTTIAQLLTTGTGRQPGSDELNLIFPGSGFCTVAPTPFVSSGGRCGFNREKKLTKIFFLRHASQHSIEMLNLKQSFYHLLKNSYTLAGTRILTERLFCTLQNIAETVPCGLLHFKNENSVGPFLLNQGKDVHAPALQS
jgi:hypothetical protein